LYKRNFIQHGILRQPQSINCIGQPKVEIKLENSVILRDHGNLKGEIIIAAKENGEANYVKLEFIHIQRTTRDIIRNGRKITEEYNQEGVL
jgi:hypothetical protein